MGPFSLILSACAVTALPAEDATVLTVDRVAAFDYYEEWDEYTFDRGYDLILVELRVSPKRMAPIFWRNVGIIKRRWELEYPMYEYEAGPDCILESDWIFDNVAEESYECSPSTKRDNKLLHDSLEDAVREIIEGYRKKEVGDINIKHR